MFHLWKSAQSRFLFEDYVNNIFDIEAKLALVWMLKVLSPKWIHYSDWRLK